MGMDLAMAFTPQSMQGLRRIRDLAWETMNIFSPVEIHDALDVDATFGVGLATTDTAL